MFKHVVVWVWIIFSLLLTNCIYADTQFAQRSDVQAFIQMMVKKHGFNKSSLTTLFKAVKIRPQVMQSLNKPLEKESWRTYQILFVNQWRIENGVKFWNEHEAVLRKAEQVYGVPASIIVATIGVETRYGERMGDYRVIDSLSNIAFSQSSRTSYFRKELEQFLLLTREQHLDPLKVMGSYAGAIGQPQFMPSSYRYYAVDFSKSGKIDLMHNKVDVIGSVANYYKLHGWKFGEPISIQAFTLGDRYNYLSRKNAITQPFAATDLKRYGMIPKYKINPESLKVKVIELQGRYGKEYWLVFNNFTVIKRYNPSDLYAMAVYQLSESIRALRDQTHHG